MNTAGGIHDVWPTKTHRVRQEKVSRLNHAGTFHPFFTDTFLGRIDVFPALGGIADHDPVHPIWIVSEETINRTRRTPSRNRKDFFHRNERPALAHFNIPSNSFIPR